MVMTLMRMKGIFLMAKYLKLIYMIRFLFISKLICILVNTDVKKESRYVYVYIHI